MSAVDVTRPREGVAQITLNRPERRNALNYELLSGFYAALDDLAGDTRCRVIVLTGSSEAERIGLVTRVVPDGDVVDAALAEAELILANSPFGVRMTKEVMWSQLEIGSLHAGIDLENRTQILSSTTGDMTEAMAAFLKKRAPQFRDE